jgi:triacylglycerol lipase
VELKGAPYPIVLAHGFFGFEEFAGLNFVTYFYKVKDRLNAEGELEVYTPAVDPFNSSDVRGEALLKQVEAITQFTGRAKVNLIGHSQGGLDARVVAHLRPDLVASVTTFATPHRGTRIADVALGLVSDSRAQDLIDGLVKLVGIPLYDAAGNQTSLSKSMVQLSAKEMAAFNAKYTDQPGVVYQSLSGRSKSHPGGNDCLSPVEPPFVTKTKKQLDGLETLLTVPGLILDGIDLTPAPHDGLVKVESARWGQFLGCVPADHFDEIGHLFGDKPSLLNDWDYLDFYVELVKYLRAKGL